MIELGVSLPPPPHGQPPAPVVEACSWCGSAVLSCLACVECLEMFCSQACHAEFCREEDAARARRNRAAEMVN
jgi:hypothetical protein